MIEEVMNCAEPGVRVPVAPVSFGELVFAPDSQSYCVAFRAELSRYFRGSSTVIRFTGHNADVTCVSLSPVASAKRLVSGAEDASVRVWDVDTGKQLEELYGHSQRVNAVSISPDEKYVASAGEDGRINVWTAGGGPPVFEISLNSAATDVAFTRDSRHLCAAFQGGRVHAWEIQGGKFTHRLDVTHQDGLNNPRTSLAQNSPPGLVISGQDRARGWSIAQGKEEFKTNEHWGRITKMRVPSDLRHIVCCYAGTGSVMWWPIVSGAPQDGSNYGPDIVSFALSPDRCTVKVSRMSQVDTYYTPAKVKGAGCP